MATLSTLQSEIANEIDRADLSSEIVTAIQAAIREIESERFTFNQKEDTIAFTASDATVALPSDFLSLVHLEYDAGNYQQDLEEKTITKIKDMNAYTSSEGNPLYCSIFESQIHLSPIPSQNFTGTILYFYTDTLPAGDTDTNIFITSAYNLVKYKAKAFLYPNLLEDEARGQFYGVLADGEVRRLKARYIMQNQSNLLEGN